MVTERQTKGSNTRQVYGYSFPKEVEDCFMLEQPILRYGAQTISRYVNILKDKWFKEILGAEKNKEALIAILLELIPERSIEDITYGRKKLKRNPFAGCRDAVFDVECTDESGARFLVEMQIGEQDHFHERMLFYSSCLILEQVLSQSKEGRPKPHDLYFDFPPTYVISFMNFSFHPDSEQILYRYDYVERVSGEMMTDRSSLLFLEMPNAGEDEPSVDAPFVQKISWAFTHMSTLRERPASLMGKVFEKFFEACEISAISKDKQIEYEQDMMTKWDLHDKLATAWRKGEQEGREEGSRDMQVTIARRMVNELGFSQEDAARATGINVSDFI